LSALAEALRAEYLAVREATEQLAAPLSPEDQGLQSMPSASPTKWHRAHTTWFFETFLLTPRGYPLFRPEYAFLFNSYYEALGPRHARPKRGLLSRPSCDEIAAYRRAVDGRVVELLASLGERDLAALAPTMRLGIAHEEQHQELLLTDVLHAFSESPLTPAYRREGPEEPRHEPAPARFFPHGGGVVTLGHEGGGFSFDNEGPAHRVFLEPFELASRPITVSEVIAFVEAGGYRTPSLWLAAGYDTARARGATSPHGTTYEPGSFRAFGAHGPYTPDPAAPAAHLDYFEADAIARFLGARLPTEAEWETFARGASPAEGNFREDGWLRPRARAHEGEGAAPTQLFGDVWEWTSSSYGAYPGFRPAAGAIGEYNGKFMVSQLVLRGGSAFTPRGHVRATYRNFWPPDTSFQLSGARLARDVR